MTPLLLALLHIDCSLLGTTLSGGSPTSLTPREEWAAFARMSTARSASKPRTPAKKTSQSPPTCRLLALSTHLCKVKLKGDLWGWYIFSLWVWLCCTPLTLIFPRLNVEGFFQRTFRTPEIRKSLATILNQVTGEGRNLLSCVSSPSFYLVKFRSEAAVLLIPSSQLPLQVDKGCLQIKKMG